MMLREPRGYPAANVNLLLPPTRPEADAGYVIMEQVEYPPMSGTNTICVVTTLLETGIVEMREPVTELTLETPAGLVGVRATCDDGKVTAVEFRNVPAFAAFLDRQVEVPHLGTVTVDVGWGGMFYVIADARQLDLELVPGNGGEIVRVTEMIKAAAAEQLPVVHPENPGIHDITIGQLYAPSPNPGVSRRNVVTVSTGAARLGPAGDVDGRDRPLAVRHGHVCRDGLPARQGRARDRRHVPPRGHPRHGLHGPAGRGDDGRRSPGGGAHDRGSGVDHRIRAVRAGPDRPVSRGVHAG